MFYNLLSLDSYESFHRKNSSTMIGFTTKKWTTFLPYIHDILQILDTK